ncbi:unnamed protein product (macronuclear) [Paramecium tetraurelia]|uniref:Uncharacterized protein n=1 Tax=Paramecium tetraurelia TaxID=5888 RepID=A0C305_PARTE|nr:uncharacterized protein GSPATT00034650001 [Paramecium tetraurelia]CAK65172.1 unnamed protein product [Paramecium tetraurelia]|eukprot:XP_001432569.1 hypothetical protein (macronuclear) [Paramecium tetraurelia strain d4-2]
MDERVKQLEKDIVQNEVQQQDNQQSQQNETIYLSDFTNLKELLTHFQNTMSELQISFGAIQIVKNRQNIEFAIPIQQVEMDQKKEREQAKQSQLNLQEHIKIANLQLQLLEQHESEQLLKIQNQALINQIQQLSQQVQNLEYQQKEKIQENEGMSVMKKFKYEQINQNDTAKQQEFCGALAFNADCSILAVGCNKMIKIFDFDQGVLKLIQTLTGHSNLIQTLNFMRNNNQQFLSGSSDNQIFVWTQQQDCNWICHQKLQGHASGILCLILNCSDDLMVSGSKDKTIKFWVKPNKDADWRCSQTISEHQDYVNAISMNENEQKLISCGEDKLILVLERPSKFQDQWNIIQKIKLQNMGFRLCFINDNQFTFQPCKQSYLSVFELDNNIYKLKTEVAVKGGIDDCYSLFPQQFNKSKNVLINKNVSNINFIRKNKNGELITEQSIDFCTSSMNGKLSNDGEYLATWDRKSWEIQIRKYQEF